MIIKIWSKIFKCGLRVLIILYSNGIIKVDVLIKIYNKIYNFGINIEIVNFF